jgi:hypothetical protein
MFGGLLRNLAPIAALALGAGLTGCGTANFRINGEEGVPLAELDTNGAAPNELVLVADAEVIVSQGDRFEVAVEGDTKDTLRFVLEGETFGITRDQDSDNDASKAIVRVTTPALARIVIGGSGSVEAQTMTANPEIVIGGSGSVTIDRIAAETLEITIGGSGKVRGSGSADRLEINVGGSGDVKMPGLKAQRAEIAIGGSGDVHFASDGEVTASIAGSGDIVVEGRATCSIKAIGSGTLSCRKAQQPPEPTAALADQS